MNIEHAVALVVGDQRDHRGRSIRAINAIKHVRDTYAPGTLDARVAQGTITDRETLQAYQEVLAADDGTLNLVFLAWEPSQLSRRPGLFAWLLILIVLTGIIALVF